MGKTRYLVPIGILPEGATQNTYIDLRCFNKTCKCSYISIREAAAHLTGYIGKVNAEDLKTLQKKGYQADDPVGKAGLEQVLEEKLRGKKAAVSLWKMHKEKKLKFSKNRCC